MLAYASDSFSLLHIAHVLGTISPKINTSSVRTPVPIPTAAFPQSRMTREVIREEALILTTLLPIKIALISLLLLSRIFCNLRTLLEGFSSAIARTLTLLNVVSAVSAEEKNADKIKSTTRITSCMTPGVSKTKSLLYSKHNLKRTSINYNSVKEIIQDYM